MDFESDSGSYTSEDSDIELDDEIVQSMTKTGGKVQLPPTVFGQNTDWTDDSASDISDVSDAEDIPVVYEDGTREVVYDDNFDFSDTESDVNMQDVEPPKKEHKPKASEPSAAQLKKEKERAKEEKRRKEEEKREKEKAKERERRERERVERQKEEKKREEERKRKEREQQQREKAEREKAENDRQRKSAEQTKKSVPSPKPVQPVVKAQAQEPEEDLDQPYVDPNDNMDEDSNLFLTMMPIKINPFAVVKSATREGSPVKVPSNQASPVKVEPVAESEQQEFAEQTQSPPRPSSKPISPASSPGRVSQLADVDPEREFPVPFRAELTGSRSGSIRSTSATSVKNEEPTTSSAQVSRRNSVSSEHSRKSTQPGSKNSSRHSSVSSVSSSISSKSGNSDTSSKTSRSSSTVSSMSSSSGKSSSSHKKDKKERRRRREKERENKFKKAVFDEEMKEKKELIYALYLLEQDGFPVSKRYTMDDDIFEMRFEYNKIKSEDDLKVKVQSAWDWFHTGNTLVEYLNDRLNPFDISMDGWSDLLDADKQKYEPHFRKLYKQFSCKFQVKPAVQIAMLFGGQLAMFVLPKFMDKLKSSKAKNTPLADPKDSAYAWSDDKQSKEKKTFPTKKGQKEPFDEGIYTGISSTEAALRKEIKSMKKGMDTLMAQIERQNQIIEQTQRMMSNNANSRVPQYTSEKLVVPASWVAQPSKTTSPTVTTVATATTENTTTVTPTVPVSQSHTSINMVPEDDQSVTSELPSEYDNSDSDSDDGESEMTGPVNPGISITGIMSKLMKKSPKKQSRPVTGFASVYDEAPEKPEYLEEQEAELEQPETQEPSIQSSQEIEQEVEEQPTLTPKPRSSSVLSRKSTTIVL